MLDHALLDILVCPESQQALQLADADLLARLNEAISQGSLSTRGGKIVAAPLTAGLIREDGQLLYPIRDDIPIMLLDEAIEIGGSVESTDGA